MKSSYIHHSYAKIKRRALSKEIVLNIITLNNKLKTKNEMKLFVNFLVCRMANKETFQERDEYLMNFIFIKEQIHQGWVEGNSNCFEFAHGKTNKISMENSKFKNSFQHKQN